MCLVPSFVSNKKKYDDDKDFRQAKSEGILERWGQITDKVPDRATMC